MTTHGVTKNAAPIWGLIGTLIYNLVYLGMRPMVPDVFDELIAVCFLVATPVGIAFIMAVRRWPSALLYDVLVITIAAIGVTLPMAIAIKSTSPYLFIYQNNPR